MSAVRKFVQLINEVILHFSLRAIRELVSKALYNLTVRDPVVMAKQGIIKLVQRKKVKGRIIKSKTVGDSISKLHHNIVGRPKMLSSHSPPPPHITKY